MLDVSRSIGIIQTCFVLLSGCLFSVPATSLRLDKSIRFASCTRDTFAEFVESEKGKVRRKITDVIWLATMWKIWKVRNNMIFKDSSYTFDELINGIKFGSWKWIRSHYPLSCVITFHS